MPSKRTRSFACDRCGQSAIAPFHKRKQRFCSLACAGFSIGKAKMIPVAERLWAKVTKGDGCWIWNGGKTPAGYGLIGGGGREGRHLLTHRVAYETANGPIPPGMMVCHSCDNPSCVRPDHLWLGTNSENIGDAVRKGRWVNPKTKKRGA